MDTVLNWFNEIKSDFSIQKCPKDIHIEEFFSEWSIDQECFLLRGINVFKQVVELAVNEKLFTFNYQLDLRIELKSDNNEFKFVPKIYAELIDAIDVKSVPELILYIPEKRYLIPAIEYYGSPLPFELHQFPASVNCFYEAYRTMEELRENSAYSRWLTISMLHTF